ncbi:hypothetical protein ACFV4P_22670 [Kitasatospora sp. NPDC059795]|uniref:hypothetical protein n=1 Tax=Kitasatospora sp. NPDC059795 TaxID=3346949 RepID=UPI00365A682B
MAESYANSIGEVSVERSSFGIAEDDPFLEAEKQWYDLEFDTGSPEFQVGPGMAKVRSMVRDHYATVRLELVDSLSGEAGGGWELLAERPYRSRTGKVEVWSLFSGPAGISLDLAASESDFVVQVFRSGGADAKSRDAALVGVPRGLEEYLIRFAPMSE